MEQMDRDPGLGGEEGPAGAGKEQRFGENKQREEPGRRWPAREEEGTACEGLGRERNGGGAPGRPGPDAGCSAGPG